MGRKHTTEPNERYLQIIEDALAVCRQYKPKFGKGKAGVSPEEFETLYEDDPFYTWFGLDSPLIYAAHKAAGGITSVYSQIGIACERLFRQVLQDTLGLDKEHATWSYTVPGHASKTRKLSLDGRIPLEAITDPSKAKVVRQWLKDAAAAVKVDPKLVGSLRGAVFEVRQGYKSKDSKRQNADIGNAANAYANSYLPTVALLSTQIDDDIAERYARAQWLILKGTLKGSPLTSTYGFSREVLGYDLAAFFDRNAARIRKEVESITEALLQ